MPQRWCQCQSCLTFGPQGRSFPNAEFKIHQLRLQREQQDPSSSALAAAQNDLFARSVADSDSVSHDAPSAMWNSREHIQAQASDESSLADSTITASTLSVIAKSIRRLTLFQHTESSHATDDLTETLQQLDITDIHGSPNSASHTGISSSHAADDTPNQLNVMDSHSSPAALSPVSSHDRADTFDSPSITDSLLPSINSPNTSRSQASIFARNKRENNVHTTRALKILKEVKKLMEECATKLNGSPTRSVRDDIANTVSQSRQKVENVTRDTPSIKTLKERVARHILHVENRLVELDSLFPSDSKTGPVEYTNRELLHVK